MATRLLIASLLIACTGMSAPARAAVQRCVAPDGQTIYTDRSCGAFDARPAGTFDGPGNRGDPATMGADGAVGGFAIRGCARTPEALLQGVRDALLARDVNRLANYYHWSGTGTSTATALMTRLERLVDAPGVADLVPAYSPASRADVPAPVSSVASVRAPATDAPWWPSPAASPRPAPVAPDRTSDVDPGATAVPAEPAAPTPPPVGLRVAVAGDGASSTTFALRRNAGCWWIQF